MAVHPHDTDRILGVLGDAIEKLRNPPTFIDKTDVQVDERNEVANDLALLHGAVSAERDAADEEMRSIFPPGIEPVLYKEIRASVPASSGKPKAGKPKDIDVKVSEAGRRRFLRLVHHEEISDEVLRGEHRDDEWSGQ